MNRQPEYLKQRDPKLDEMMAWPGTPGRERLLRAVIRHQEGEDHPDARIMAGIRRTMGFRDEAMEAFLALDGARDGERTDGQEQDFPGQVALMGKAAMEGTDADFIGMCIATHAILDDEHAGKIAVTFTRIPRDQDWMGMEPAWPDCRNQGMHIFGTRDTRGDARPCLAMSLPRTVTPEGNATAVIPEGEAANISRIAEWHGALFTSWVLIS